MHYLKFFKFKFLILWILFEFNNDATANISKLVFVVLSQEGNYHAFLYNQFYNNVQQFAENSKVSMPAIYNSHTNFSHIGHWTIIPLIPKLRKLHYPKSDWFIFCEDRTSIDIDMLLKLLQKYNPNENIWFGHALFDREPTIIHHFGFPKEPSMLKYPNIASGFVMSTTLINSLADTIEFSPDISNEFSIDAAYELALTIWNEGRGSKLIHEKSFCVQVMQNCTTYPLKFQPCGELAQEEIYFAVKTTKKFHRDRVDVVKKTWGRHAHYMGYFSETEDATIPTIKLDVRNSERGHCQKTYAIIQYVSQKILNDDIKWIVIADDDTILSAANLQSFLTCYNSTQNIAIGQRYGYNVHMVDLNNDGYIAGYNYITGGGGMVFSSALLRLISKSHYCKCPSDSTPDDMFLGFCLLRNGIDVLHSSKFHQARPDDYAPEYLAIDEPISFHKHWLIDPFAVYNKWFAKADMELNNTNLHNKTSDVEEAKIFNYSKSAKDEL